MNREDETRAIVTEGMALLNLTNKPLGRMRRLRELWRRLAALWLA